MIINLNDIALVFCNLCEFEKILRNNIVLWQAYMRILVTLHSNNELKAIELLLNSETGYKDIKVVMISKNSQSEPILIKLHGDVDHDYSKDPLTFIAEEADSTVRFNIANGSYQYSTDRKTWNDYTGGTTIKLNAVNDYVSFRAAIVNETCYKNNPSRFYLTGKVAATGNIMSLLNKDMTRHDIPRNCFLGMFEYQTALTEMPYINANSMGAWSCHAMFRGCNLIRSAKVLSATADCFEAYSYMFADCTDLSDASGISINISSDPATNTESNACRNMFENCTSLVNPPAISSTTLYEGCYQYMFNNCTSLAVMPTLPATSLPHWSNGCYDHMFCGCTKLSSTEGFKLSGSDPGHYGPGIRFRSMFEGCSKITKFVADFNFNGGVDSMFKNCTSLKRVEVKTTWFANQQNGKWLEGTPNTTECLFKCPDELSTSIGTYGRNDSTVPSNWTIWYESEPEPQTYTLLQYLTMSGKQHIDTGIVPTDVETKMKFNMTAFDLVGGLLQHADPSYYQVCLYQGDFCIGTNGKEFSAGSFILNAIHEITYNQIGTHDFIVDGAVAKSVANITSQNSSPLLIGGYRPNVTYNNGATIIFYRATLTNRSDGKILRDFIPVKDKSGVTCIYDKISKTFFYNKGTGSFVPGPISKDVYLEYIESDGNQWIDTEFKPCASTQYNINYMLTVKTTASWPSAFGTKNGQQGRYTIRYYNDYTGTGGFFQRSNSPTSNWGSLSKGLSQNDTVGKIVNCKLQNNTVYVDGTSYGSFGSASNDDEFPYSIYLFTVNDAGIVHDEDKGCIRIYNVLYFDKNGNMISEIIPMKTADDIVCMYDTVREKYLYNKGTGNFTAGPEKTT